MDATMRTQQLHHLSLVASPLPFPLHLATPKIPLLEDLYKNYFTPTTPSLPRAYIWPEHDRPSSIPDDIDEPLPTPDIPVIDMDADTHTLIADLAHACEHWGVFYVTNHGVPLDLLERVREKGLELFSLPLTTKMRARRKEGSFEGFGKAPIGKFFDSLMWSEGFTMMGYPTSSIADTTSKLCTCTSSGSNEFSEVFEEYDGAVRRVAARLLRAIVEGLGVGVEAFRASTAGYDVEKDVRSALQLNYYAPCPQPHMTMGLPAHTDSTLLTLLYQGLQVPGLEVQLMRRPPAPAAGTASCTHAWTLVPPLLLDNNVNNSSSSTSTIPGSPPPLVVHVGDVLQVLSNGRYKSVVHRAIANKSRQRLSVVSPCFPPLNATIAPPKVVIDMSHDQRPLYKPFKWEEYMQAKSKYFMGALDHFTHEKS